MTRLFKFGFTEAIGKGKVVPNYVICLKNLSNDALRPRRLQGYLRAKNPGLQEKNFKKRIEK